MDKKEMQEFLDLCVEDGKSELKSYRDFLKVLGLKFNGKKQEEMQENKADTSEHICIYFFDMSVIPFINDLKACVDGTG